MSTPDPSTDPAAYFWPHAAQRSRWATLKRCVLRRCALRDGWVWFDRCWHRGWHGKNGRHLSW